MSIFSIFSVVFAQTENPVFGPQLDAITNPIEYLQTLFSSLIGLGLVAGGLIFMYVLISGAIDWVNAGGDKARLTKAREKITNAFIGIVVLFAFFAAVDLAGCLFNTNFRTIYIGQYDIAFIGNPICPSGGGGDGVTIDPTPDPGLSGCTAPYQCTNSPECEPGATLDCSGSCDTATALCSNPSVQDCQCCACLTPTPEPGTCGCSLQGQPLCQLELNFCGDGYDPVCTTNVDGSCECNCELEPSPTPTLGAPPYIFGIVLHEISGGGSIPRPGYSIQAINGGSVVATTTSDRDGNFILDVSPGTYDLLACGQACDDLGCDPHERGVVYNVVVDDPPPDSVSVTVFTEEGVCEYTPPPGPSLNCSVSANPQSGDAPLDDVDITINIFDIPSDANTGGWSVDCDTSSPPGSNATGFFGVSGSTQTVLASNACGYSNEGVYTASATVAAAGENATCTTQVLVGTASPTPTPTPSETVMLIGQTWIPAPGGSLNTASGIQIQAVSNGSVVATTTSDSDGTYVFDLPPNTYDLVACGESGGTGYNGEVNNFVIDNPPPDQVVEDIFLEEGPGC